MGNVGSYVSSTVTSWTAAAASGFASDNDPGEFDTYFDLSHRYPNDVKAAISKLPPESLPQFTSVNLADCDLVEIPEDVFQLTAVEEIDVSWNKLVDLSPLAKLPHLTSIICKGNLTVKSLPSTLQNLNDLEVCTICKSGLEEVKLEVAGLSKLREVSLCESKISVVSPQAFSGCASLVELNLSKNHLTALPEGLLQSTTGLRRLHVMSNALLAVPDISQLGKLEIVSFRQNRIATFPKLGVHITLTEIDLSLNQIEVLPKECFSKDTLPTLTKLELAGNKLTSIPETIAHLPALAFLGLSSNQLSELPPVVYRMSTLKHVNLTRNKFSSFPNDMVFLQYSLESLYLSHNAISILPPFLIYFTKLRGFSITGNPLQLEDPGQLETYRTVQFIVRDRNRGKFMGRGDEVLEDEYWKTVWGPYNTEWQGLFPSV